MLLTAKTSKTNGFDTIEIDLVEATTVDRAFSLESALKLLMSLNQYPNKI